MSYPHCALSPVRGVRVYGPGGNKPRRVFDNITQGSNSRKYDTSKPCTVLRVPKICTPVHVVGERIPSILVGTTGPTSGRQSRGCTPKAKHKGFTNHCHKSGVSPDFGRECEGPRIRAIDAEQKRRIRINAKPLVSHKLHNASSKPTTLLVIRNTYSDEFVSTLLDKGSAKIGRRTFFCHRGKYFYNLGDRTSAKVTDKWLSGLKIGYKRVRSGEKSLEWFNGHLLAAHNISPDAVTEFKKWRANVDKCR